MELLLKKQPSARRSLSRQLPSKGEKHSIDSDSAPTVSLLWQDKYQPIDVKSVSAHSTKVSFVFILMKGL